MSRHKKKNSPIKHTSDNQIKDKISSQHTNLWNFLIIILFVVLGFVLYSNTFHSPFLLDDEGHIVDNSNIRLREITGGSVTKIFTGKSWNRPLPMLSFALNYYFGRYHVQGYHVVNIMVHVITGILLFFFLRITLNISNKQYQSLSTQRSLNPSSTSDFHTRDCVSAHPTFIAFYASLIWFVHPLCTQSVTYIVQRMNSMAAMFYILSLWFYAKARLSQKSSYLYFAGCAVSGICALLSKEISATLPFFIFLYEWYFFQNINNLNKAWFKRKIKWILFAGIPIILIGIGHYSGMNPEGKIFKGYSIWDFTWIQRVMTEFRVVIYYLSLILYPFPSRLNFDYDYPISYSLINPLTTLFSLAVIIGLVILAFYLAKRKPLISFCIFWYFGNLAIESSFIPLHIIFEHRTYLPSMLVSLLVVIFILQVIKQIKVAAVLLCIVLIIFSTWTYKRNGVYKNAVSLWADTVKKSPNKAQPHYNLGIVLSRQGEINKAIIQYTRAIQISPYYAKAHNNLGNALMDQGQSHEAMSHYTKALRTDPEGEEVHNNLGKAFMEQGQLGKAKIHYNKALEINPDSAEVHNNFGILFEKQGKSQKAINHYKEALQINPDYADVHNNLGNIMRQYGKFHEAIAYYNEALRLKPEFFQAHYNMANTLMNLGQFEEAVRYHTQALRINPNLADAHNNLGVALMQIGQLKQAIGHFQEAVRINPDDPKARYILNEVLKMLSEKNDKGDKK